MNIWTRLIYVAIRAGLIALGTLLVERGILSSSSADWLAGDAAIWIASGIVVIGGTTAVSAWEKVKQYALAHLAATYPAGTKVEEILDALPSFTAKMLWLIARGRISEANDRALTDAERNIRERIGG